MDLQRRTEKLRKIKDEVIKCEKCPLYKERKAHNFYPVIGEGSHTAKIMFVGEAPGLNEAKSGRPFCGAAGKVLDELLLATGIKREDVYITNLLKDRPPSNRDPLPEEIIQCAPFLERQIEIISPKAICPLGRHSMKFLMEKFGLAKEIQPISKIHGKVFQTKSLFFEIKIIPFYHPAVAVYNPSMKEVLKKDFQVLKKL
jgi:DNA polymerase